MKKKIIIILITVLVLILVSVYVSNKIELYINWKIYLPGIQNRKKIYEDFFQDGDEIYTFKYNSKWKMNLIKDINHFQKISLKNTEDLRSKFSDFYEGLGPIIDENSGKAVYDKNINVNELLNINNYYLIKEKKKSYLILILDFETKQLYTFITIRH